MLCVFKAGSGFLFKKQLVPDPHREKRLDPDPQKMNADPQPSFILKSFSQKLNTIKLLSNLI